MTLLRWLSNPSTFCRAMLEGDTKSNSDTASSQPAISKGDATDENIGNSDVAAHQRISLEENIADATPAVTSAATPSMTPAVGRMSAEVTTPAPGNSSKSLTDAIIAAGDKHAALLRDLVKQFSSSRQVHTP